MDYNIPGHFWLPDNPARRLRGELTWSARSGGELRLEHLLIQPGGGLSMSADVIEGRSLDGTPLVLLKSFVSTAQIAAAVTQHWVVNQAYVGTDAKPSSCLSVTMALDGLTAFTARSGLAVSGTGGERDRVEITWEARSPPATFAFDGWTVELVDERSLDLDQDQFSVAHVERLRVAPQQAVESDAAFRQAALAAGLLEFLADRPMPIERQREELPSGLEVERLFRSLEGRPPDDPEVTWLKLHHVESNLARALAAWKQLDEAQQPLVSLVLEEVRLRRASNAVTRILRLTQIIELLHRHRHPTAAPEDDDEREKTQAVLNASPEELRGWLADRLGVSRIRLRQRIRESLTNDLAGEIDDLCGGRDAFASTAAKTRNWHTHFGRDTGVAFGMDAAILAQRLWFIVRGALLVTLGWASAEAGVLLKADRNAEWLTGRPQLGN